MKGDNWVALAFVVFEVYTYQSVDDGSNFLAKADLSVGQLAGLRHRGPVAGSVLTRIDLWKPGVEFVCMHLHQRPACSSSETP